ncbi:Hypp7210 [Branchiostoma lanceolatum]|uniref:Hypp7210 protein n=1 Tax=Branchiostoma lanceolatum TaxID=7740 RepID=A0A8K0ECH2_BRALA|nr:Hypp7210 [Branchiostoma lanceolatum]
MSEAALLSEETLPGSVPACVHGLDIVKESSSLEAPSRTSSKEYDAETCPDEGSRLVQGLSATEKPHASFHSTEPAESEADKREERSLSESPKAHEAPERDSTGLLGANTQHQLCAVSSTNAEGPGEPDSLGSGPLGMADAPSPLEALRAHLRTMVQDERDFVHTLNSKLTRLEGVVRNVREEKNSLAAEFQDLEEHVDKLNGGVRAFDAEMRDYSLGKTARDNLSEEEALRRTDSRLSFDIPEIGVSFAGPGGRARRGLWSRGKRWWRKKNGKVTPEKEEDIRELAADATLKLEEFLKEKL